MPPADIGHVVDIGFFMSVQMKRIFVAGLAGFALSVLAGCQQSQAPGNHMTAASDIDQDTLCQVSTWKPINVASQCEAGQKILYRPGDEAGSEQSALFTAANCDLRFTVSATPGGTTCIYRPIRSANALATPDDAAS